MIQDRRVQQMRLLCRLRPAPDKRPIQSVRHRARILRDIGRQRQRARQDLRLLGECLGKQAPEMPRRGGENTPRGHEVEGLAVAN